MNKKYIALFIIVIILVAMLGPVNSDIVQGVVEQKSNIIKVSGTASIESTPDIATVNVGVVVEDVDLEKAVNKVRKTLEETNKILKELKVESKDIKTTYYNVNPKYEWDEVKNVNNIVGYKVMNQLEIRVRDIDNTGKIIDSLTSNGSNIVSGVTFSIEDEIELYNKALENAVEVAEKKALVLGKKYGITKVKPIRIEELSSNTSYKHMERDTLNESVRSTPISTGDMEVTANVIVEFGY